MFIYTLPRVPGAAITTPWETFCHSKSPFVVINYDKQRPTSRWQFVERKRKFSVTLYRPQRHMPYFRHETLWYMTLAQAEAGAAKVVAEEMARWDVAKDDGWKGVRQ